MKKILTLIAFLFVFTVSSQAKDLMIQDNSVSIDYPKKTTENLDFKSMEGMQFESDILQSDINLGSGVDWICGSGSIYYNGNYVGSWMTFCHSDGTTATYYSFTI